MGRSHLNMYSLQRRKRSRFDCKTDTCKVTTQKRVPYFGERKATNRTLSGGPHIYTRNRAGWEKKRGGDLGRKEIQGGAAGLNQFLKWGEHEGGNRFPMAF